MRKTCVLVLLFGLFSLSFLSAQVRESVARYDGSGNAQGTAEIIPSSDRDNLASGREDELIRGMEALADCDLTIDVGALQAKPRQFFGIASGYTLMFLEFWRLVRTPEQWRAFQARFESDLTRMRELGVGWLLCWILWSQVEPVQGQFRHLDKLEWVVDRLRANQIEPIFDLHGTAPWDNPPEDDNGNCYDIDQDEYIECAPRSPINYGRSLENLARRFQGKVWYWKILEEENEMFYGHIEDLQERARPYAALLQSAYDAIQRVNATIVEERRIQVILGGIHVDEGEGQNGEYLEYTRHLLNELLRLAPNRPLFDIIAFHQHRFPYGPLQRSPFSNRTMEEEIRDYLAVFDATDVYRDKKLWITNLSWPGMGNEDLLAERIVSECTQARYTAEAYIVMTTRPVLRDRIEGWGQVDLRDAGFTIVPRYEMHYGLMRHGGGDAWSQKPAYTVYEMLPRL